MFASIIFREFTQYIVRLWILHSIIRYIARPINNKLIEPFGVFDVFADENTCDYEILIQFLDYRKKLRCRKALHDSLRVSSAKAITKAIMTVVGYHRSGNHKHQLKRCRTQNHHHQSNQLNHPFLVQVRSKLAPNAISSSKGECPTATW